MLHFPIVFFHLQAYNTLAMKSLTDLKETWTFCFEDGMLFSKKDIDRILFPLIFETLLSYLIGMMDSVMVSSAGEAAVSAVSLVDAISLLFINIFAALANGGAVVCGQFLGMRSKKDAEKSAAQMLMLMFFSSLIITVLLLVFKARIIAFLYGSAEEEVRKNCDIYYRIVMLSVPFIALYNGGAALFRTTGDSATPLRVSLLMNAINIIGNAVLIYVFQMGVAGVAIPTLISRGVAMVIILVPLFRKSSPLSISSISHYHPEKRMISGILAIGVPNGIENGMFQFGKLILLSLISTLSTAAITANAIGNSVGSLHCVVGIACNSTIMPVISRCVGARDYRQARWYTRYLLRKTYLLQGVANILMIAVIPVILRLYNCSEQVAYYAVPIMLIHGISSIFLWPAAFMLNIAMRSAGDSRYAMWIASISMWLCRVCGSYLFVKYTSLGVFGVWIAWDIDWLFRMAFFIPRYIGHKWETKAIHKAVE